jgi:hypothetical protein
MSSQSSTGKLKVIQGDASNWTQFLKRKQIFNTLKESTPTNTIIRPSIRQSTQLLLDYRIGNAACPFDPLVEVPPYPKSKIGDTPC